MEPESAGCSLVPEKVVRTVQTSAESGCCVSSFFMMSNWGTSGAPAATAYSRKNCSRTAKAEPPQRAEPARRKVFRVRGRDSMPGHSQGWPDSREIWEPVPMLTRRVCLASRTEPRKLAWLSPTETLTGMPRKWPRGRKSGVIRGRAGSSAPCSSRISSRKVCDRQSYNPMLAAWLIWSRGRMRPVRRMPR